MPPVNERLGIDFNHVKCVIEALLITTDNSLTVRQIYSALGYGSPEIYDDAVKQLNFDYHQSGRSFEIQKIAGGYQIFTLPRFSRYVENLWAGKRHSGLSRGALETAAITAYRQPVTRLEIEEIRGVNCDSVLQSLLDKGLIKVTGRKKAPGRPIL
ncbi:MAG: SMC-Scp complex subunit ScpB, partial [FCB group bacterium]|nr:SMC-Scp complex subunit ScpB [FCB group bacterium]